MILLIGNTQKELLPLQIRFYRLGLATVTAGRRNAEALLASRKIHAVYLPAADETIGAASLCRKIRKSYPTLPILAAIAKETADEKAPRLLPFVDHILLSPIPAIRAVEVIFEFCRVMNGIDLADLHVGPLILNLHLQSCFFYTVPVKVSLNELLILRYLAEAYPERVSSRELAAFAGNPETKRKEGCIRSHIFSINRLSKRVFGQPIILWIPNEGYTIAPRRKGEKKGK